MVSFSLSGDSRDSWDVKDECRHPVLSALVIVGPGNDKLPQVFPWLYLRFPVSCPFRLPITLLHSLRHQTVYTVFAYTVGWKNKMPHFFLTMVFEFYKFRLAKSHKERSGESRRKGSWRKLTDRKAWTYASMGKEEKFGDGNRLSAPLGKESQASKQPCHKAESSPGKAQ